MKYTPEEINKLERNQIFVFGSNTAGRHGAGAARQALKWGARYGVGIGLEGQTYALPTKDHEIETLSLYDIEKYIKNFLEFAKEKKEYEFLVTKIGCGLAGYTTDQIGKLFGKHKVSSNVILPIEFAKFIKNYGNQN
jgi:hypothetical protein